MGINQAADIARGTLIVEGNTPDVLQETFHRWIAAPIELVNIIVDRLAAAEAEVESLRELLRDGADTIEMHTLVYDDGMIANRVSDALEVKP